MTRVAAATGIANKTHVYTSSCMPGRTYARVNARTNASKDASMYECMHAWDHKHACTCHHRLLPHQEVPK